MIGVFEFKVITMSQLDMPMKHGSLTIKDFGENMNKQIKIGVLTLDMGSVSHAVGVNTKDKYQYEKALQFAVYQASFEKKLMNISK